MLHRFFINRAIPDRRQEHRGRQGYRGPPARLLCLIMVCQFPVHTRLIPARLVLRVPLVPLARLLRLIVVCRFLVHTRLTMGRLQACQ